MISVLRKAGVEAGWQDRLCVCADGADAGDEVGVGGEIGAEGKLIANLICDPENKDDENSVSWWWGYGPEW